jgi:hypothetical protein
MRAELSHRVNVRIARSNFRFALVGEHLVPQGRRPGDLRAFRPVSDGEDELVPDALERSRRSDLLGRARRDSNATFGSGDQIQHR